MEEITSSQQKRNSRVNCPGSRYGRYKRIILAPAGASGAIAQLAERCFNCLFNDPGSNPGGSITDCATVKMYKRLFIRCDEEGLHGYGY